jgi:hypothetical protein
LLWWSDLFSGCLSNEYLFTHALNKKHSVQYAHSSLCTSAHFNCLWQTGFVPETINYILS